MLDQGRIVSCGMVREFSEEKRQEIFRLLDDIDNSEWKSFMEWCGSRAEEFGDWPDKLAVSAYTRYVDEYHQKILDLNEMTRQRVNTVFENVAEIDARYAARMRECREKIKEQVAIVRTMTEFMESMIDGTPNMALITKGSVNENCVRTEDGAEDEKENTEPLVVKWEDIIEPVDVRGQRVLAQCLRDHGVTDQDEIDRVLEWIVENNFDLLNDFNNADIHGDSHGQNKEEIYNTIMEKYNGCARKYFLEYAADSEYDGYYDFGKVVYILQKLRPGILKDLYEIQSDDEKAAIFKSIIKIYDEYRIEQGAIILADFIEGNIEIFEDDEKPELIVPLFRLFDSNRLIYLYQIKNEVKDTSAQKAYCESLIEISKNYTYYQKFYAYTWLQINSIENFTRDDDFRFDQLVDTFVGIYEENIEIYNKIAEETGVPPEVVAVIHYRENSDDFLHQNFNADLLDGHDLGNITQDKFIERASNAIQSKQYCIDAFNLSSDTTDVVAMVCFAEAYNGFGYYESNKICPYSYSGTDVYVSGKYPSDGVYDPDAVDKQIGTYRLLLAVTVGIYDAEDGKNYVNEMCGGDAQ